MTHIKQVTKYKLLIVDDDSDVLDYLEATLCDDYDTKTAENVASALEIIKKGGIDIILTDLVMPKEDGVELIEKAKNIDADILSVVLSGKGEKSSVIRAIRAGAFDFLEKPVSNTDLMRAIDRCADNITLARQQAALSEARIEAQRLGAIGLMTAGIAHEIATPITLIKKAAKRLREDSHVLENQKKDLDSMVDLSDRMKKLVKSIKSLTFQVEDEKSEIVDLREVLQDVLQLCRSRLEKENVSLKMPEMKDSIFLECHLVDITQVFHNLIYNAVDAMKDIEKRWIEISLEDDKEHAVLAVTDAGRGIAEDIKDKIFEPRYTTKKRGEGTGLGLYMAKRLLASHGGSISLDSENEHTRFLVKVKKAKNMERKVS